MPLKNYSPRPANAAAILPEFPYFSMTESAEQPLLEEQNGATKKPAKKRTTKPLASVTKATKASKPAADSKPALESKPAVAKKPAAKRVSKKVAAKESQRDLPEQLDLPGQPAEVEAREAVALDFPAPKAIAAKVPEAAAKVPEGPAKAPEPSVSLPGPVCPPSRRNMRSRNGAHPREDPRRLLRRFPRPRSPLPRLPSQWSERRGGRIAGGRHGGRAPAGAVVKQRPVYIPRHVAKQMEEQARLAGEDPGPIPVSLPASEAPRIQQFERAERAERPDRGDRGDRGDRFDRSERSERQETPKVEVPPRDEELGEVEGIVEVSGKGFGFLRDPKRGFAQHPNDVFVTPELCRSYNLRDGQWVKGQTRRGNRGSQLYRLISLNEDDPAKAQHLPAFDELTVISPLEMIRMETVPERYTTRVIDMMTPIGKGQRG